MNTLTLHRNHLADVLSALSLDEMAWAMKFLADKISCRLKMEDVRNVTDAEALERAKTERFLSQICGKWEDDKDADEMVRDIYESRVNKDWKAHPKYTREQQSLPGGWLLNTHSSTKTKKQQLEKISAALGLGWKVEIIAK